MNVRRRTNNGRREVSYDNTTWWPEEHDSAILAYQARRKARQSAARDKFAEDMIRHLFLLANSDPNGPGATDYAFYPAEIRQAARWLVDAVTTEADDALAVLRDLVALHYEMYTGKDVTWVTDRMAHEDNVWARARALVTEHTTDEETT